jgi:hypothetical protein
MNERRRFMMASRPEMVSSFTPEQRLSSDMMWVTSMSRRQRSNHLTILMPALVLTDIQAGLDAPLVSKNAVLLATAR